MSELRFKPPYMRSQPLPEPDGTTASNEQAVNAIDKSLNKAVDGIARVISGNKNFVDFHYGVIVSAAGGTATVTISGGTTQVTGVRYLADVTPVAGNVCVILSIKRDLLIIGTLT